MNTRSHRSLLILCGCLVGILAAVTGRAEDFYIAETTLGNGSGSSASNAKSVAWFNTSGNWSSTKTAGKVGPGDTVRLVGTIASPLTVQASGSAGNPITILFSKDAKMSSPAFPGTGAIAITGKHYITVDGGENGIIENTANGSSTTYPTSTGSVGVYGTNLNYLIVKNLTIKNMYVRSSLTDTNWGGYGVRVIPTTGYSVKGIQITGCTISDVETGVAVNYRLIEVSDIEISHNTVFNVNHGLRVGDAQSGARCTDVRIHNNRVYGFSKWDESGTNKFHHNGVFCFATNSDSQISNVSVYANTIGSDFGKHSTSGIYFSGWVFDSLIYNNVMLGNPNTPANGLVTMRLRNGSRVGVYNNTFIGNGTYGRAIYLNGVDGGLKTADIANNIATKITFIATTYSGSWTISSDYNLGETLIENRDFSHSTSTTGSYKTAPQWQSMGYDLNGRFVSANMDSNYELIKGSPAIDSAKDLSAYFNTDKNGVIRPVGSGWDIGAYESIEGLTGTSSIVDDSTQVVVDDTTTDTNTGSTTGDVVIDFEQPVAEEPIQIVDSSTGTNSTGSTTDTSSTTEDTIEVVFNPAPSTDTSTTTETTSSEPVIVADSSTTTETSGSTSEPVSDSNTLEPPTTSEPVIVADSSTSTDTPTDSSTSTTEPASSTDSSTIVVVDSSTGTDSTDTSTDTQKGKPGNGYGRETNGKITKTARIL